MQLNADLRRGLEAVRYLGGPEPPWATILATANSLVGGDAAVLLVFDGGRVVDVQKSGADDSAVRDYADHFHMEDVMTQPNVQKSEGIWLDTQRLLPTRARGRNSYYVDFMCRHRMRQLYSLILEDKPGRWTSLGFQRSTAWDGLSDLLNSEPVRTFSQSLQRAVQMRRAQAASWLATTDSAFDALEEASCLVHATGELVHASPLARCILDRGDSMYVVRGRIAMADARSDREFQMALHSSGHGGEVHRLIALGRRSGERIEIELVRANSALRVAAEELVFVRIRAHSAALSAPPAQVLSAAFRITPAEARVLHALASGATASGYATHTGVSFHTVRKQIASMMLKMSCTRQVDLVRAALQVHH
ncbi:helix-turn-helix transcriptional regulator [Variovorax sp. 160MFSha2.1]|uniref:helix-turn-helix transcriptional regulator n=1 Tax=Variovorax sp. 160MFSha2.1 TaxID=3158367 RepID=UPI003AB0FC55